MAQNEDGGQLIQISLGAHPHQRKIVALGDDQRPYFLPSAAIRMMRFKTPSLSSLRVRRTQVVRLVNDKNGRRSLGRNQRSSRTDRATTNGSSLNANPPEPDPAVGVVQRDELAPGR